MKLRLYLKEIRGKEINADSLIYFTNIRLIIPIQSIFRIIK